MQTHYVVFSLTSICHLILQLPVGDMKRFHQSISLTAQILLLLNKIMRITTYLIIGMLLCSRQV